MPRTARMRRFVSADPARSAFIASLVLGFAVLGFYARHFWFFGDEFNFLVGTRIDDATGARAAIDALLRPHNEHLSALPRLWYWLAQSIWGLTSYWPYVTAAILVHLGVAVCVWSLARRLGATPWIAWGTGTLMILFGGGAENIFWGFQVGFMGALLLGLVTIILLDGPAGSAARDAAAAMTALLALGTAGVAVPVLIGAFAFAVARRGLVRAVLIFLGPVLLYAVWYVRYRPADGGIPQAHTSDAVAFAVAQLSGSLQAIVAVPGTGGILLLAGLAAVVMWSVRPSRARPLAFALLVASVMMALITGIGRAALGLEAAGAPRYFHIQGALLLPVLAALAASLPTAVPRRRALVASFLALAIVLNLFALRAFVRDRSGIVLPMREQVLAIAGDPLLAEFAPGDAVFSAQFNPDVTVDGVRRLVREGQLPAGSAPASVVEALRSQLLLGRGVVAPASPPAEVEVVEHRGVTVGPPDREGCRTLRSASDGQVDFELREPAALTVDPIDGVQPRLSVRFGEVGVFDDVAPIYPEALEIRAPAAVSVSGLVGGAWLCVRRA